jgi:hypothetical protein
MFLVLRYVRRALHLSIVCLFTAIYMSIKTCANYWRFFVTRYVRIPWPTELTRNLFILYLIDVRDHGRGHIGTLLTVDLVAVREEMVDQGLTSTTNDHEPAERTLIKY